MRLIIKEEINLNLIQKYFYFSIFMDEDDSDYDVCLNINIHPEIYLENSIKSVCNRCYCDDWPCRLKKYDYYFCLPCRPVSLIKSKCPIGHSFIEVFDSNIFYCESCCRKLKTGYYYLDQKCRMCICSFCYTFYAFKL